MGSFYRLPSRVNPPSLINIRQCNENVRVKGGNWLSDSYIILVNYLEWILMGSFLLLQDNLSNEVPVTFLPNPQPGITGDV